VLLLALEVGAKGGRLDGASPLSIEVKSQTQMRPVGVIGGGQLAQMLALAARSLGIPLMVQAAAPTDPAVAVADGVVWGAVTDTQATAQLLQRCPVVTLSLIHI